jgi:hypothetical protein
MYRTPDIRPSGNCYFRQVFTEAVRQRQARVYHALPEYRRRLGALRPEPGDKPEHLELTTYEYQVCSQNGEDGVLAEVLRRIGVRERTFVEFGVETGSEGNCVALADIGGWNGLFIEADPDAHHHLHQKYRWSDAVRTLHAAVTPQSVQDLFVRGGVPEQLDVLSIDIDGGDYWVWQAIEAYRPRVVVIEYNSALDPAQRLVQPADHAAWDGTDFFGASLGALVELAGRKGYRLVHCELAGVNAFFVHGDEPGEFPAPEDVQRRGPNYYLGAFGHPPGDPARRYERL